MEDYWPGWIQQAILHVIASWHQCKTNTLATCHHSRNAPATLKQFSVHNCRLPTSVATLLEELQI